MANMNVRATFTLDASGALRSTQAVRDNLADAARNAQITNNVLNRGGQGIRSRIAPGGGGGGGGAPPPGGGGGGPEDFRRYRGNRGAASLRGASGRDFAGLAQAGEGTSGLVAAYATLAANIFAVTTAFKALSDAAKTVQLEKGLEAVGALSGKTLLPIARDLREISGYAITAGQSMSTVASATAAGLKGNELKALTKIAKGASIALGRDMSDSMDRLIRGTIKLEPELLDELGIFTKINDATAKYALENNKTASSLTNVERRQAFVNAIIAEGASKFNDIADAVPVSSFDKLSASVQTLGTGLLNLVNNILQPLLDLALKFPQVILLAVGGMASSVFSKLMPGIDDLGTQAQKKVDILEKRLGRVKQLQLQQAKRDVGLASEPSKGAFNYMQSKGFTYSTEGGNTPKAIADIERKTKQSLIAKEKNLLDIQSDQGIEAQKKRVLLNEEIRVRKEVLSTLEKEKLLNVEILRVKDAQLMAENQKNAAVNQQNVLRQFDLELAGSRGLLDTLSITSKNMGKAMKQAFADASSQLNIASTGTTRLSRGISLLSRGWRAASIGATGFGSAASMAFKGILASLGPITAIITTIMTLWQIGQSISDWITGNTDERKAARDDLNNVYETSKKIVDNARKFRQENNFASAIGAAVSSMTQLTDAYNAFQATAGKGFALGNIFNFTKVGEAAAGFGKDILDSVKYGDEGAKYIKGIYNSLSGFGPKAQKNFENTIKNMSPEEAIKYAQELTKNVQVMNNSFDSIQASAKDMETTISKIRTADIFNTPLKPFLDQFKNINTEIDNISKGIISIPGASTLEAKAGIADRLLGSKEALTELSRIGGPEISGKILASQQAIENTGKRINNLKAKGNSITLNEQVELEKLNNTLTTQKAQFTDIFDKTLLIKVETAAYDEALGKAKLKLAQMNQTYIELQANAMKQANSIARMKQDIDNLNKYGRKDFGPIFSGEREVANAREAYDIALRTAKAKKDVIQQEADLLKLQTKLEIETTKATMAEKFKNYNPNTVTADEMNLYNIYSNIITTLESIGAVTDKVTNARQQEVDIGLRASKTALDLAGAEQSAAIRNQSSMELKIQYQEEYNKSLQETLSLQQTAASNSLNRERESAIRAARAKGLPGLTAQQEIDLQRKEIQQQIINAQNALKQLVKDRKSSVAKQAEVDKKRNEDSTNALKKINERVVKTPAEKAQRTKDALVEFFTNMGKNQAAAKLATEETERYNIAAQDLRNSIIGLIGTLLGLIDASEQARIDFDRQIQDIKTNGTKGSDLFGALFAGMGLDGGYMQNLEQLKNDPANRDMSEKELKQRAFTLSESTMQANMLNDAMIQVGQSVGQAFTGMVTGSMHAKDAFRQMTISILNMLAQMLAQMAVMAILKAFIFGGAGAAGGVMPAGGPETLDFSPGAAGGIMPMAQGGVMSRATPLQGIVTSPTYLVGEGKYNEAVVPLPNGRDIPVQLHGSNDGTNNISINVNMASNGSTNTQMSGNDGSNLGAAIARAVQKELLAQKAPGGILNKYGVA